MDKKDEETHSMDKPKPLEVVSDGDLSEVKKDPEETKKAWEVWLKEKDSVSGKQSEDGLPDKKHNWNDWKYISQRVRDEVLNEFKQRRKKSYVTKPIPDSKGGRGSFQHCIDTNQDKNNPGGWCKQIERKIGGDKKKDGGMAGGTGSTYEEGESKDSETQDHVRTGFAQNTQYPKKGKDEGEGEEVKISMYEKLRRIKDKLEAHNKAKKVPNKEVKLPQTKIDGSDDKHMWDHSKVGRNTGWEDNPMNKPSYFQARMEEERQKKAKKKAGEDKTDDVVSTVKRRKRLQDYFENKTEEPESDYYMDAGGNPQQKEKKYTPKHPMTRVHNRESELRQEQRKTKPHKFCPTCGDKMPIETRRRVEEKEKADYFVEEIRSNIMYHNKILPLIGMVAGQAARGMGKLGKKVGGEILEGAGELSQGVMQEAQEEEEQ